jgi:hypothetical protein
MNKKRRFECDLLRILPKGYINVSELLEEDDNSSLNYYEEKVKNFHITKFSLVFNTIFPFNFILFGKYIFLQIGYVNEDKVFIICFDKSFIKKEELKNLINILNNSSCIKEKIWDPLCDNPNKIFPFLKDKKYFFYTYVHYSNSFFLAEETPYLKQFYIYNENINNFTLFVTYEKIRNEGEGVGTQVSEIIKINFSFDEENIININDINIIDEKTILSLPKNKEIIDSVRLYFINKQPHLIYPYNQDKIIMIIKI